MVKRKEMDRTSTATPPLSSMFSNHELKPFSLSIMPIENDIAVPPSSSLLPLSTFECSHPAVFCIVTEDVDRPGGPHLVKGDIVKVDWSLSTCSCIYTELHLPVPENNPAECDRQWRRKGSVPKTALHLLSSVEDKKTNSVIGTVATDSIIHYDSVWDAPSSITTHPQSFANFPLLIEPGLISFIWPLRQAEFSATVYQHRPFVSHATGHRLSQLKSDLLNFTVKLLLDDATKIVVWMRTSDKGRGDNVNNEIEDKMQYLEASSDVAYACYRSGHSLYFNPSFEIQKKYIVPLLDDLGHDQSLRMHDNRIAGDLEIFAVNTRHHTPWHFDAQENFSIQLVGTKRWRVRRRNIANMNHERDLYEDVMTNLHPSSSNKSQLVNDIKTHIACGASMYSLIPPQNDDGVITFVLRPGSVLYLPAGMWHSVSCEDDEGSLSINFSLDPPRWMDFILPKIATLLMANKKWRQRIQIDSSEGARNVLKNLLLELPSLISSLSPMSSLPDGMFSSVTDSVICVCDNHYSNMLNGSGHHSPQKTLCCDKGEKAHDLAYSARIVVNNDTLGFQKLPVTIFSRNVTSTTPTTVVSSSSPLSLLSNPSTAVVSYSLFSDAGSAPAFDAQHQVHVFIPTGLLPVADHLVALTPHECFSLQHIQSLCSSNESSLHQLLKLLGVLCLYGYLRKK